MNTTRFGTATTPHLIAGALAVALVLAGTRWASYLGVEPLFLTDVLLILGLVHFVLTRWLRPEKLIRSTERPLSPILLILVAGWAFFRFIAGLGDFSFDAVRDAMPYFYPAFGLMAWASMSRSRESAREQTNKLLIGALVFHAIWYFAQIVYRPLPLLMPTVSAVQGLHVFSPRPDVDCALVGVLAAMLFLRVMARAEHRLLNILGFAGCWIAILSSSSRAGLLGAILVNLFAVVIVLSKPERGRSAKKLQVLAAVPILFVALVAILPSTTIGTRLLGTISPDLASTSAIADGAAGTTLARENAWGTLSHWLLDDPSRTTVGVGFGPNFLAESGADVLLIGSSDTGDNVPRSPHDYWLGTFARTGIIGLALVAIATLRFMALAWQSRQTLAVDATRLTLTLIPLSLLIPATLGVVLESPFAAVPFWWCIGALLGMGHPNDAAPTSPIRHEGRPLRKLINPSPNSTASTRHA